MRRLAIAAMSAMILTASAFACGTLEGASSTPSDDAASDSAASDAVAADDAADAGADVTGTTPCKPALPQHFCDDFDDLATSITFGWDRAAINDGGAIGDTDAAFSPPRALVASLPGADGGFFQAALTKTRPPGLVATQRATLSFQMRLDEAPSVDQPGAFMHIAALILDQPTCDNLGPGQRQRHVELDVGKDGLVVLELKGLQYECVDGGVDAGPSGDYLDFAALSTHVLVDGMFHRFDLVVSKPDVCSSGTGSSVGLLVDGKIVLCESVPIDPFSHASNNLDLELGLSGGGQFDDTRVTYDDVVFDVE